MKRIKYFDILRVICFFFIIFYHMIYQLQAKKILTVANISGIYSNSNMHLATLAVAIFFMLSGASLMYSNQQKDDGCGEGRFDIKNFYKKRLLRLLIPFYLTYSVCFIITKILGYSFWEADIPKWRFIFTLFGMDGWASIHGIDSFYLCIGEWFLGCIIVLYILFPVFRWLLLKHRIPFLSIVTLVYFITLFCYNQNNIVPIHESILIKGYEFILGMLLGVSWQKIDKKWAILTVPVVIFFFISPVEVNINPALKITIFAAAFFITFSFLESVIKNRNFKIIDILSDYSYDVFLVHHFVMSGFTQVFAPYVTSGVKVVLLCLFELIIIVVFAIVVHRTSRWILKRVQ